MIKEVKLPEVSDNVETGDVIKVLVKAGDKISIDQPIIELETEKASFEVPSTENGIVSEVNVKQGDIIRIGAVILKVETEGSDNSEDKNSEDKNSEDKNSEDKNSEDKNTEDKNTEDKNTEDKNTEDKNSEVKKPDVKKEPESINSSLPEVKENTDKKYSESENADNLVNSEDAPVYMANKNSAPASPSVRRLARELGVDVALISGTEISGRVTEDDVKKFIRDKMNSDQSNDSILSNQKSLPDFKKWGETKIQPMSKIRTLTADAMTYSWTTIPMVTQFDKADITDMEEFRKKNLKKTEAAGGSLTVTSILVKVCEAALKKFPQFNSSIDLQNKEVILKKYFNVGIAVDTDRGLLVPVIKNTDRKNITEISIELGELAEKARSKKITPDEMDGGNFTISNLGGIGGVGFTPIVYSPQVAILGVSRAGKEAVYLDGSFQPRMILPLSLTYDHRIIDGADAARFLRWICESLENPMNIFL